MIGADGLHSRIRALTFAPAQQFERDLGYIVAAFEVSGYRPRNEGVYMLYGRPGRMAGRFALHDDRTLFLLIFEEITLSLNIATNSARKRRS